jgi:CHAD domain-containing protein
LRAPVGQSKAPAFAPLFSILLAGSKQEIGRETRTKSVALSVSGRSRTSLRANCAADGKRLLSKGKRLDKLEPQRRHRLRIRTKKLRYATEFFAGVFPAKKSKRRRQKFAESLEKLQDSLGDLNDIAVHEELSERLAHSKGGSRRRRSDLPAKKAFAAGRLSGREEARIAPVIEDAQRAYAGFAKAKPFWA